MYVYYSDFAQVRKRRVDLLARHGQTCVMPGHSYVTTAAPELLERIALATAAEMEFTIEAEAPGRHIARKGSFVASLLVGAFVAYCDFRLVIALAPDSTSHLIIERNTPWWTGFLGVNRVKNRARELADACGNALVQAGVQILARNDA